MIATIEEAGYSRGFFHLSPQFDDFTFYTFGAETYECSLLSHWNLIGIREKSLSPALIEVLITNIDEEELRRDDFIVPDRLAASIAFSPQEMQEILHFFQSLSTEKAIHPSHHAFIVLSLEQAICFGLDPRRGAEEKGYYRYLPPPILQPAETISIIGFPQWKAPYGPLQHASLSFRTFSRSLLADPHFQPLLARNVGYMVFNQETWHEFIALFQMHLFRETLYTHQQQRAEPEFPVEKHAMPVNGLFCSFMCETTQEIGYWWPRIFHTLHTNGFQFAAPDSGEGYGYYSYRTLAGKRDAGQASSQELTSLLSSALEELTIIFWFRVSERDTGTLEVKLEGKPMTHCTISSPINAITSLSLQDAAVWLKRLLACTKAIYEIGFPFSGEVFWTQAGISYAPWAMFSSSPDEIAPQRPALTTANQQWLTETLPDGRYFFLVDPVPVARKRRTWEFASLKEPGESTL